MCYKNKIKRELQNYETKMQKSNAIWKSFNSFNR